MDIIIRPGKLKGTLDAMPSKSHAHRILIAQKLAELGGVTDRPPLDVPAFSEDIEATADCLSQLGKDEAHLDCRESGSTLRFLIPVAMASGSRAVFSGRGKLPKRPVSPLKEAMEAHGCRFSFAEDRAGSITENAAKDIAESEQASRGTSREMFTVTGKLLPGRYELAGNVSSQFITGLLFALPLLEGDSTIALTTPLESSGYVDLTLRILKDFGIEVKAGTDGGLTSYTIPGRQRYRIPSSLKIESDWSNAACWLVCGALGGDITLKGLDMTSAQGDKKIVEILSGMGARVDTADDSVTVSAPEGRLTAYTADVSGVPDLVPVLSSAMAYASGTSHICNAARLRIKESDRLASVTDILSSLGACVTQSADGLTIEGRPSLAGGTADSHNDHRIVMAVAAASCICRSSVLIRGAEAVNKSYPRFFEDFRLLGGRAEKEEDI